MGITAVTTNKADIYKNKFKDKDWLYQKYVTQQLPIKRIALSCRCHIVTIHRYVKKFGFPLRKNTLLKNGMWGKSGSDNPNWRGGKYTKPNGYVCIRKIEHPHAMANGYVTEHRLVMEEFLGRYLKPQETIHHINGIKNDNRIENLALMSQQGIHTKKHYDILSELYQVKAENQKLKLFIVNMLGIMYRKEKLQLV